MKPRRNRYVVKFDDLAIHVHCHKVLFKDIRNLVPRSLRDEAEASHTVTVISMWFHVASDWLAHNGKCQNQIIVFTAPQPSVSSLRDLGTRLGHSRKKTDKFFKYLPLLDEKVVSNMQKRRGYRISFEDKARRFLL